MAKYTSDDLNKMDVPQIQEDGSVKAPGLISLEEAVKMQQNIDKVNAGQPITDIELQEPETPLTEEEKPPEETVEKPRTGIELDVQQIREDFDNEKVTIGGKTKTNAELITEMEKRYKTELSALTPEELKPMVDDYIIAQHDASWKKANNERSQQVAKERKNVEAMKSQALAQKQANEQQKIILDDQKSVLLKREDKLKKKIDELQTLALKTMKPEDLYITEIDGTKQLDLTKLEELNDIKQARRELKDALEEQTELQTEKQSLKDRSVQSDQEQLFSMIELLQVGHPELITNSPIREVAKQHESNPDYKNPDMKTLLQINELVQFAINGGVSLEVAYEYKTHTGQFAETNQLTKETQMQTTQQEQAEKEKILENVRKKQTGGTKFLDGKGATSVTTLQPKTKTKLADVMSDSARRAIGGGSNPALDKLGF